MVILYERFGGLSNNLFQHIHFNSFCKENKIQFVNFFIKNYAGNKPVYTLKQKLLFTFRKPLHFFGLIRLIEFNEDGDFSEKEALMKTSKILFVKGWAYRALDLTEKDREYYREYFFKDIGQKLNHHLSKNVPNIGIHIRRGDYKYWENGKYFYDDNFYLNVMKKMQQLHNGKCNFLIFSNDKLLDKELYRKQSEKVYLSMYSEKEDHYLLSQCSYILGPPSSFTILGAYLGFKKIYLLKTGLIDFDLDSFYTFNG
jgi:hypothetical protein